MLKWRTLESLYCKNPMVLLSELLSHNIAARTKTIVTYGNDTEFIIPEDKDFTVINISMSNKHHREYHGFLNSYHKLQ